MMYEGSERCACCGREFETMGARRTYLLKSGEYCPDCLRSKYTDPLGMRFVEEDISAFVCNYFGIRSIQGSEDGKKELCQTWYERYLQQRREHSGDCDEAYLQDYCLEDLCAWGAWLEDEGYL